ncbi:MAG: 23S rRNA (cytosine1962-C5)-methyltransferase [Saprospiraceae bacterium]|jgi:23S rRNA (cytosine1962-C5)-methyltransferase
MKRIVLKRKRLEAIQRRHPWVFSGAIHAKPDGEPDNGEIVLLVDGNSEALATGHYANGSIALRLFAFEKTNADQAFWTKKIADAYKHRQAISIGTDASTDCYRLVHAEGDGLPGLIIDIYGKTAVVQCHSVGMHKVRDQISTALQAVLGDKLEAIYDKSAESVGQPYSLSVENKYIFGKSTSQIVKENDCNFFVDWEAGQKTGFFLDQRDNRQLLSRYSKGKTVLNAFAYSGGFSVYALRAGANIVHSVDVSKKAIEWTDRNIELNKSDSGVHESYAEDVMAFLKNNTTVYDTMVIDPPAFAKNIRKKHNAVQGYKRLNALAIRQIAPGGIIFTFSCSQVVDRQLFYDTITAAGIEAGRNVRVIHHLSQPADHPVNLFHPEGSYLKGLVLRVD